MARWETAYEKQMEIRRFWQSDTGSLYAAGFAQDVADKMRGQQAVDMYSVSRQIELSKMAQANPIFVDEEMFELWEHATKSFKPEPLEPSDLITLGGFLYLPKPQYMFDVHGKAMSFRAISWMPVVFKQKPEDADQREFHSEEEWVQFVEENSRDAYGINLSVYTSKDDEDDYNEPFVKEMRELQAQGQLSADQEFFLAQDLTMLHMENWAFGRTFEDMVETDEEGVKRGLTPEMNEHAKLGFYDFWRKTQALFRLMQQKITTHDQERPPRATRRRAKAMEFDDDKAVTVIRLRRHRPKREDAEERDVPWSHRWLVDAHWRNQWYPSLNLHRQIWIAPYVKGPEDKELRLKDKAYELVR